MIRQHRRWLCGILVALLLPSTLARQSQQTPLKDGRAQPNIVFILTDDQDLHMDSLAYMPHLQEHLVDQGTSFTRHYCTVALCCPSRASLWTGKAAHNTNVTDVNPPYGGYPKFVSQGFNDAYLPLWLQAAGYNTYYVGKLFNAQTVDNYASPRAAGWTGSEFLLDPYTYEYLNTTFTRNGGPPASYEGQYSTDIVAAKAHGFLEDALQADQPFFLTVAPIAPHCNVHFHGSIDGNFTNHSVTFSPPIPADRHKHLFEDAVVPRTPNFNPAKSHGVSWISHLQRQNQTNVDFNDDFYRNRLRALQAVDEMIDSIVTRLAEEGVLDNTYVIYSTDNGYHIGQHRLQPGKQCAFEEDINIPFIVRGPGIAAGHSTDIVTSHTDLAPTFLRLAGGEIRDDFDGTAFPLSASGLAEATSTSAKRTEHVNVESWGISMPEGKYGSMLYANHTYKALRVIGEGYNYLYTVWCSGEHELYDLVHDPYETHNLYPASGRLDEPMFGLTNEQPAETVPLTSMTRDDAVHTTPLERLIPRLDALLMVLKTCKAAACQRPWMVLHPSGDVHTLQDALDSRFNAFYAREQKRVKFERCEKGYILESEGPVKVEPYLFDSSS